MVKGMEKSLFICLILYIYYTCNFYTNIVEQLRAIEYNSKVLPEHKLDHHAVLIITIDCFSSKMYLWLF